MFLHNLAFNQVVWKAFFFYTWSKIYLLFYDYHFQEKTNGVTNSLMFFEASVMNLQSSQVDIELVEDVVNGLITQLLRRMCRVAENNGNFIFLAAYYYDTNHFIFSYFKKEHYAMLNSCHSLVIYIYVWSHISWEP